MLGKAVVAVLASTLVVMPALAITEKTKPLQYLNYSNRIYPLDGGALKEKIESECRTATVSCTFTLDSIYWHETSTNWDKWRWTGTKIKTYPADPNRGRRPGGQCHGILHTHRPAQYAACHHQRYRYNGVAVG